MISLERVTFAYPGRAQPVFDKFSLSICPLSWVALTGPDGSGKTTFGKLLKGLLKPTEGLISFATSANGGEPTVGYVGEDPLDYLVGGTVEEDVAFGLENLNLPPDKIRKRLALALKSTGLVGMERRVTGSLPGGEQQRLALASMLAVGARIVVLDDSFSMLDRPSRADIRLFLDQLRRDHGLTVIEITQNLEDAAWCDRLIFIQGGTVAFDGPPASFLSCDLGHRWAANAGGPMALLAELAVLGLVRDGLRVNPSVIRLIMTELQK